MTISFRSVLSLFLSGLIVFAPLPASVPVAQAASMVTPTEAPKAELPNTIPYNGVYHDEVQFKLPEFRGIEPRIGLNYDSGRANSSSPDDVVGAGWRLSGFSSIQRASSGRGLPNFDSNDIYLLDGQELLPCGDRVVAGCGAGGTHVRWVENYQRIKQVTANNTWEVTARDGTRYVYAPLGQYGAYDEGNSEQVSQATQYRYLLKQKFNPQGQHVDYSYSCSNILNCVVTTVAYGSAEVRFHWQTRPEAMSYAGGYSLGNVTRRLATVEVRSAGQMLRTYSLSYSQSPASGRSMLVTVQERGRDSVIESGLVTSGTAMPAYTFQYTGSAPTFRQVANGAGINPPTMSGDDQLVAVTYGDFGADRNVHMAYVYGHQVRSGSSDNRTIDNYCVLMRSDTGETTQSQVNSGQASNTICNADDVQISFLRNIRNQKKSVLLSYSYERCSDSECNNTYKIEVGSAPTHIADFDGDGLDDYFVNKEVGVEVQSYSKSGSAASWSNIRGRYDHLRTLRDFNGDGKTDLLTGPDPSASGLSLTVRLSNGVNGFVSAFTQVLPGISTVGDFNGDGVTDLLIHSGGVYQIYYTAGRKFVAGPQVTLPAACEGTNCFASPRPFAADVDGDGRDDLISHRYSGGDKTPNLGKVFLNRGNTFVLVAGNGSGGDTFSGEIADIRDADWDGIPEIALKTKSEEIMSASRYTFISETPDLLKFVKRPLGQQTSVSYTRYAVEQDLDFPLSMSVVSRLETFDGRRVRATTDLSYEGGKWDWEHRQFLGFRKITAILPQIAGETGRPSIETTYRQDIASIGKVSEMVRKDGTGTVLEKRTEGYAVQATTKPYTSLNNDSRVTSYFGTTARTKRQVRYYNSYGVAATIFDYGNNDDAADDRRQQNYIYPNVEKYIADKPGLERTFRGLTTDISTRINEHVYYYDNDTTSFSKPVEIGNLTKHNHRFNPEDNSTHQYSSEFLSYDSYGNMVSHTDEVGGVTKTSYDSTYHVYPTGTQNPLYATDARQKTSQTWDMVCGVPLTETDENGSVTRYTYDALCRQIRIDLPGGGQVNTRYVAWGTPTKSYTETRTKHPNGAAELRQRTYFDGFNRVYGKAQAETADDNSQMIAIQTEYDLRGNVERVSNPFETGATPIFTVYSYDGLDRLILEKKPGGATVTTSYLAGDAFSAVSRVDELGHRRTSHFDARGNEVYRDVYVGSTRNRTIYAYDLMDRLTSITDPLGSTWSYLYDGHGNKTALKDPDLGCQQMTYDNASRLTQHKQANGTLISYQYDKLGRVTKRTVDKDALQFPNCVGENDAPKIGTKLTQQTINEDQSWSYAFPATAFIDPDGDALTFTASLAGGATLPSWLAFNASNRTFSGTPPLNYFGDLTLEVAASDGQATTRASFKLTIRSVNDVPVLKARIGDQVVLEDTRWNFTVPAGTFFDVETSSLTYTATLAQGSALPSWLAFTNSTRTFSGTPPLNFNGAIQLKVTASDGEAAASDSFTLTVKAANDNPRLVTPIPDQAVNEDTAWTYTFPTGTFQDADGDTLSYTAQLSNGATLPSWLSFVSSTRKFSGTPPANYNGTLSLKITASDGLASVADTFNLVVKPVNDAPVLATAIPDRSVNEDTAWSYTIPSNTFSDADGTALSYSAKKSDGTALPSWISFAASTRVFSGTPPANYNGYIDIKVTVTDGLLSASDTFRLTVKPVNDAPVARNDTGFSTNWENAISIAKTALLSNDTDVDGQALTITSVANAANGSASIDGSSVRFVPIRGFSGTASFNYSVTDGAATVSATVFISVTPPPVTPGSVAFTSSGTFKVPYYNTITVEVIGGGGGGGARGTYCCGSDGGWDEGLPGGYGGTSGFMSILGGGGGGGRGGAWVNAGDPTRGATGEPGVASGGNVGNYVGGGSAGGAGEPTSGNGQGGGDGGNGGRAVSQWSRGQSGAPTWDSSIPVTAASGGSPNGQSGKVLISWQ